jgi:exopolyphosphatase/guanosine-5'-triphosphate,3'-diphosphate pyrophosphatase
VRLLEGVADRWDLADPEWSKLLGWAALVHEIGTDIAHSQYHKHGYYLLVNMDLAGFSRDDQRRLALLVRSHRRKFPLAEFMTVPEVERKQLVRLAALLRIAVVLHRNRTADPLPECAISAKGQELRLSIEASWLSAHPLTCLDLDQERAYLESTQLRLDVPGLSMLPAMTE